MSKLPKRPIDAKDVLYIALETSIPAMLRERAKTMYPQGSVEKQALRDLADDLEQGYGI